VKRDTPIFWHGSGWRSNILELGRKNIEVPTLIGGGAKKNARPLFFMPASTRGKVILLRPNIHNPRPHYPEIDPAFEFQKSVRLRARPPYELLRMATRVGPVAKCIQRIQRGLSLMPWYINPPKEDREKPGAIQRAEEIRGSLARPNYELAQNTYTKFTNAVVKDLLTLNYAAIQRMHGNDDLLAKDRIRRFFAFCIDAAKIEFNPAWQDDPEEARYLYRKDFDNRELLADEDMYIIQIDSASYELMPPSPVEVAFPYILSWLALNNFQHSSTSKVSAKYILDIGDVSQAELDAFREYWNTKVEIDGQTPIAGGKGLIKVVTLGASSDSELYLGWTELLLRLICMPFGLTPKDLGHEQFTYATAGVSADASYQEGVVPIANIINEHENLELIQYYEPGFTKEYADLEKRTEEQEATRATMLFEKNLATRNEMRLATGLQPIGPAGDKFMDGTGLEGEAPQQAALPPGPEKPPKDEKAIPEEEEEEVVEEAVVEKGSKAIGSKTNIPGKTSSAKTVPAKARVTTKGKL